MKTAQDSYTITIKQIVRFQEMMHLEKIQVDKIKNGRLSAIIHLDRPDIAEYCHGWHICLFLFLQLYHVFVGIGTEWLR